ncbi:MAG: YfiR family protein [Cryomorphaceae bacterium]|nr:YfiR family protein [Flavobacteriales bacterium]
MKYISVVVFLLISFVATAQQVPELKETDTSALIKASYIYNFAKNVDWNDPKYKTGNFVISIMGGSSLHKELVTKYNTKQIGSQQIEIRKLSKTLNISSCHVLYVGAEYCDILPDIAEALKNEPTLIVADKEGALDKGAALNFVIEEQRLKFELNMNSATKRNLFVGSTLKSLATKIQ